MRWLLMMLLIPGLLCAEELTEEEAVIWLLQNNPDLKNAEIDIEIAQIDRDISASIR